MLVGTMVGAGGVVKTGNSLSGGGGGGGGGGIKVVNRRRRLRASRLGDAWLLRGVYPGGMGQVKTRRRRGMLARELEQAILQLEGVISESAVLGLEGLESNFHLLVVLTLLLQLLDVHLLPLTERPLCHVSISRKGQNRTALLTASSETNVIPAGGLEVGTNLSSSVLSSALRLRQFTLRLAAVSRSRSRSRFGGRSGLGNGSRSTLHGDLLVRRRNASRHHVRCRSVLGMRHHSSSRVVGRSQLWVDLSVGLGQLWVGVSMWQWLSGRAGRRSTGARGLGARLRMAGVGLGLVSRLVGLSFGLGDAGLFLSTGLCCCKRAG